MGGHDSNNKLNLNVIKNSETYYTSFSKMGT
jgi:hypothetical protein